MEKVLCDDLDLRELANYIRGVVQSVKHSRGGRG
jgi:hypothetical protein